VVVFSKGKIRILPAFFIGHERIEVVTGYNYLGIWFNCNTKFTEAINLRVKAARNAALSLNSKANKLKLPLDIRLDLLDKLVVPVVFYGCEIWGFSKIDQNEVFYRKCIKHILGVSS
jgi:hypothetical protein